MLSKRYRKSWQTDNYFRDQDDLTKIRRARSKDEITEICNKNPTGAVVNLAKLILKTRTFKE